MICLNQAQCCLSVCADTHIISMFSVPPLKFRMSGFTQYGFKLELNRNLRHGLRNLNARYICIILTMTYMQLKFWSLSLIALMGNLTITGAAAITIKSRDTWLSCGLCCPTVSSLTMVSSETLDPFAALFSSSSESLRYCLVCWYREFPQFTPPSRLSINVSMFVIPESFGGVNIPPTA